MPVCFDLDGVSEYTPKLRDLNGLLGCFQGGYSLQGVKKIYHKDRNGRNEKLMIRVRHHWEQRKYKKKKKTYWKGEKKNKVEILKM